jgi:hypothetical protein
VEACPSSDSRVWPWLDIIRQFAVFGLAAMEEKSEQLPAAIGFRLTCARQRINPQLVRDGPGRLGWRGGQQYRRSLGPNRSVWAIQCFLVDGADASRCGKESVTLAFAQEAAIGKHLGIGKSGTVPVSLVLQNPSANWHRRHIPQPRQGTGCIG